MKKVLAILLAAALCLSMFACGENAVDPTAAPATDAPATEAPATEAPVTAAPTETPTPTPIPTPEPAYHVDLSTIQFSNSQPTLMKISEIPEEDAAVKQAFLDAGHAETDNVLYTNASLEAFVNDMTADTQPDIFESGTTWKFTTETYCTGSSGGYVIIMDGTSSNFLVTGGAFGAGYALKTTEFTMPETNISEFKFYNSPSKMYIADISIQRVYKPNLTNIRVGIDDVVTHDLTEEELAAGYTFDFSEGNVIDLSNKENYFNIKKIPGTAEYYDYLSILTTENGFKDYAYYTDGHLAFYGARGLYEAGKSYQFTLRVYSEKALTVGSNFAYCLQMANCPDYNTDGYQSQGSAVTKFVVNAVEGMDNVYDLVATAPVTDEDVNLIMVYNCAEKVYVSSVTIKCLGATPAE